MLAGARVRAVKHSPPRSQSGLALAEQGVTSPPKASFARTRAERDWAKMFGMPAADLSADARAGRETGAIFRTLQENPETTGGSLGFLGYSMRRDLSQGGTFDYQRDGFTRLSDYRNVSNFNVGLYSQQAGLSLDDTPRIAGAYGKYFSNNPEPRDSYGLTDDQRRFMKLGYRAGQRGGFGSSP